MAELIVRAVLTGLAAEPPLGDDRFCRCQVRLRARCPGRARVICVAVQDVWVPVC